MACAPKKPSAPPPTPSPPPATEQPDPADPTHLLTVYGVGYKLNDETDD